MRFHKTFGVVLAFASVMCFVAAARAQTTWYVDCAYCPGPGSGTPEDPFCTIQAGIDASSNGDTVQVADGTYTGVGNKDLDFGDRAITVGSAGGPYNCIIDCENNGRGFHFHSGEDLNSVVVGFTITRGNAGLYGGGMFCQDGSPTVKDCIFKGNSASHGGGMANGDSSSPTVVNCLFIGNTVAGHGGGMHNWNSDPTLTNCTFTGNVSSTQPDGGMINFDSNPALTNCILWGDLWNGSPTPGEIANHGSSSPVVTYCCIEGGYEGDCNIGDLPEHDPQFVDAANGDLHLSLDSPCIDAGSNGAVPAGVTTDLDGNPRFVDDICAPDCPQCPGSCGDPPIVDMGAYERQADGDCDGVPDDVDNCPEDYNPDQEDFDDDGDGDACDSDIDDDGVVNEEDVCPYTPLRDINGVPTPPLVDFEGRPVGDINLDCYTDLVDYQLFQQGFTGPLP